MKTKSFYSPELSDKARGALFQRMLTVAIIVVLMVAFLPVSSVFAAPASDDIDGSTLGEEWSNKLNMIHAHNLFYAQVKLFPADYGSSEDMARPYELLAKYGFALKQANGVILKHTGFDETGHVIDEEQAIQSAHDLGMQLSAMRGLLEKFDEEGYKLHRIK